MAEPKRLRVKICLVGEKGVGKTSLIRRYVLNQFDDRYIMTVGAKVSKKEVQIPDPRGGPPLRVDMMIWDVIGHKGFLQLLGDAYFHGANGILAVADLTRPETLEELGEWVSRVRDTVGLLPIVMAMNKADLVDELRCEENDIARMANTFNCEFFRTSARTGEKVEEVFRLLGELLAQQQLGAVQEPAV